jgi:GT2 family glycosyltransferase
MVTVLLLNRAGKFDREEIFEELESIDFVEILCVEGPGAAYDLEDRSRRFPNVRFLLLSKDVSIGSRINLGMDETRSRHVVVTWSDMRLSRNSLTPSLIEQVDRSGKLCIVPLIRSGKSEPVPTLMVPVFEGRRLKVIPWRSVKAGMASLFPFDYCGIYDRRKYRDLGGFDEEIFSPYWQKLDLGFRAYMWGDRIECNPAYVVEYYGDATVEDSTPDSSYKSFYLKNIGVKRKESGGVLSFCRFPGYVFGSNTGPIYSLREFLAVRSWVKDNAARFKLDCREVAAAWEMPE